MKQYICKLNEPLTRPEFELFLLGNLATVSPRDGAIYYLVPLRETEASFEVLNEEAFLMGENHFKIVG